MVESPNANHVVKIAQIVDRHDTRFARQSAGSPLDANVIRELSMVMEAPGWCFRHFVATKHAETLTHLENRVYNDR